MIIKLKKSGKITLLIFSFITTYLLFSFNRLKDDQQFIKVGFRFIEYRYPTMATNAFHENGTRKFIQFKSNEILTTEKEFSKRWRFTALPKHILKFSFKLIKFKSNSDRDTPCKDQSHILLYDDKAALPFNVIAEICGDDWKVFPVIYSSSNFAIMVVSLKQSQYNEAFDVQVEVLYDSSIPSSSFICNQNLELTNDETFLYPDNFPKLHFQAIKCINRYTIAKKENLQGFGRLNMKSLSISGPKSETCQHKLSIITPENGTDEFFRTYAVCGFSSLKMPIYFQNMLRLSVMSDQYHFHQGFFISIVVKYCPFDMVWDQEYCEASLTYTCNTVHELKENSLIAQASCNDECKCPIDKPFWDITLQKCMSWKDCLRKNSDENVLPNAGNPVLVRKIRAYKSTPIVVPPTLDEVRVRPLHQRERIRCVDTMTSLSYCVMQRTFGRCTFGNTINECRYTCELCVPPSWSSWSSWSTCSRDCRNGQQLRFQFCDNCDENAKMQIRDCVPSSCSGTQTTSPGESVILPRQCEENSFLCVQEQRCIRDTLRCNGYPDCSDGSDEPGDCPLGLRFDGRKVIINWATHNCLDATTNSMGQTIPWGFRRCPGQRGPELDRYWWRYTRGRYREQGGVLEHVQSGACLAARVTNTTVNGLTTTSQVSVVLEPCDMSFRSRQQFWECEPASLRIRLTFPSEVLPQAFSTRRYLSLSRNGPGMTLELTDQLSEETTDFSILETDQFHVCSERRPDEYQDAVRPRICSQTCGGGVSQVLRDCARLSPSNCPSGEVYELAPCNTQPCPGFCPPDWTVMDSENSQNLGCFKVFRQPASTFNEAQAFCASRNWTLASDKNEAIHEALLTLIGSEPRVYIGIYEDVQASLDDPPSHRLRYTDDRQPVGTFQPWLALTRSRADVNTTGCVLGRGDYYGSWTSDRTGRSCSAWDASSRPYQPLQPLQQPYFLTTARNNTCQNPNLDPNGPWCYTMIEDSFEYCNLPDCLDFPTTELERTLSNVDSEHVFLIRSQRGQFFEGKWCLSGSRMLDPGNFNFATLWACDPDDTMQHFYWLSSTTLVNIGTKSCLSVVSGPTHGERLAFRRCSRRQADLSQAWVGIEHFFFSAFRRAETRDLEAQQYFFKLVLNPVTKQPFLVDVRRTIFVAWTEALGTLSLSSLLERTPSGPYVLLRSSGQCLTHDSDDDFNLIRTEPCSQQRNAQRWVILANGHLMNAGSGKCLTTSPMQGYAVMFRCMNDEMAQVWQWNPSITERITVPGTSVLRHSVLQYFLRTGCDGLSSVCMAPTATDGNATWEFIPGTFRSSRTNRAAGGDRASARGVLGYPFLLQSPVDLTRCARPYTSFNSEEISANTTSMRIIFLPCFLQNTAFLWWFSGIVTQIKHRNLDLCLDADASRISSNKNITEVDAFLKPCSLSSLHSQSWTFTRPFPNGNDITGSNIRLASDRSFYLALKPLNASSTDDFMLVLRKEDDSDKWDAFNKRGFAVQISEMTDCILPWTKQSEYRGTRSWTRTGIRCQPWKSQVPRRHPFTSDKFSNFGLDANRCRRPPGPPTQILDDMGQDRPWCLTLRPETIWQDCVVSRCKVLSVVTLVQVTNSWEATPGDERLPFICQSTGECYRDTGLQYRGLTSWTGRGFCLNWREYYGGQLAWPDHNRCMNPSPSLVRPWCWVRRGALQYCDTLERCMPRCSIPRQLSHRMKIVGISYSGPTSMYAAGSRIQAVCKQGYNVTLPGGRRDQVITCGRNGEWSPSLVQCRKIFCPLPLTMENAYLLTSRTTFTYGSVVTYHCRPGYMIRRGVVIMKTTCQRNGVWSEMLFKCEPSCPTGWVAFQFSCYLATMNRSVYVTYNQAAQRCNREGGNLAVPNDENEHLFFRYAVMRSSGFSDNAYWLGLSDTAASLSNLAARLWNPIQQFENVYLDRMRNFHQFKIRNIGSIIQRSPRYLYSDRCMYGDRSSRRVFMTSCAFENEEGLQWSWLTHQHLYNVDLGLCLSASMIGPGRGPTAVVANSVRLETCDSSAAQQRFTCGPHNGYLLKLREAAASFLTVDMNDPLGEVLIGGSHVTGPSSQWHSFPGEMYLCHWQLKPTDSYFIVHRNITPGGNSFGRFEQDKCLQDQTGAVLAQLSLLPSPRDPIFDAEYLNWCNCLYMLDENGDLASASLVQGEHCARPNTGGASAPVSGVIRCAIEEWGDSLCRRTDGSSPSVRPVPQWCSTISVPSSGCHYMSPRQCSSRQRGYLCEREARWLCGRPVLPDNSVLLLESGFNNLRFTFGSVISLRCLPGHRFFLFTDSVNIMCNHRLQWEIVLPYRSDNMQTYTFREDAAAGIGILRCDPARCSAPNIIPGITWEIDEPTRIVYNFGTNVTYTCTPGTEFSRGVNTHVARCSDAGSWQPELNPARRCQTVQCLSPPSIPDASVVSPTLSYEGFANYSCPYGKWFRNNQFVLATRCNATAMWDPDPSLQACIAVCCFVPNATELLRKRLYVEPNVTTVVYSSNITFVCNAGYWFDKGSVTKLLTCDASGRWLPISPARLQCRPVYCDVLPTFTGAITVGSDNSAGGRIIIGCSPLHWIRPSFKIYHPHWDLCVTVEGGTDRAFYYPMQDASQTTRPFTVALAKTCAEISSVRDSWVWHWSFHLRNRFSDTCLTATASPTFRDKVAPVTIETCDRQNLLQQWQCGPSSDGGNARQISLRQSQRGPFLTTSTYAPAFWSGRERVYLVVAGDYSTAGVESSWHVYGASENSQTNICMFREGHAFTDMRCSNEGNWVPQPLDMECTLVDCGPPPMVRNGQVDINRPMWVSMSYSHFAAPSLLKNIDPFDAILSYHPVSTVVSYYCNPLTRQAYTSSIICRENGVWQNFQTEEYMTNPSEMESYVCGAVTCPPPNLIPPSYARLYPSATPKIFEGKRVPSFRGFITYMPGMNLTYQPEINSTVEAICETGFWVLKNDVKVMPQDVGGISVPGTPHVRASCQADGAWSEPLLDTGFNCTPVYCMDPGHVSNARRYPPGRQNISLLFAYAFLYQCQEGYWFSRLRSYTDVRCDERGLWNPDPISLRCVPGSCRTPSSVAFATRFGDNFTIGAQVQYKCQIGRFFCGNVDTVNSTCSTSGFWFPPPSNMQCHLLECIPLPIIPHSSFVNFTRVHNDIFIPGDFALLRCDMGFTIDERYVAVPFTCNLKGFWEPRWQGSESDVVRCSRIHCPAPPQRLQSRAQLLDSSDFYRYQDMIRFTCPLGMWNAPNGYGVSMSSTCTVQRIPNATLQDPSYAGYWQPRWDNFTCTDLQCQHPGVKSFSTLDLPTRNYMVTATYTCARGYRASSPNVRGFDIMYGLLCGADGFWQPSPLVTSCVPVQCPEPGDVPFARRLTPRRADSPYYYQDMVIYECFSGRKFIDLNEFGNEVAGQLNLTITCLHNGTWSSRLATFSVRCEPVSCRAPPFIRHSSLSNLLFNASGAYITPARYAISSTYQISCGQGYVNSQNGLRTTNIRCTEIGLWEPINPNFVSCERVHCVDPGNRTFSTRVVDGFRFNDRITYFAQSGYASVGFPIGTPRTTVVLQCSEAGSWRVLSYDYVTYEGNNTRLREIFNQSAFPFRYIPFETRHLTFVEMLCPPPVVPDNSQVVPNTTNLNQNWTLNAIVSFQCNSSYFLANGSTDFNISCTVRGDWFPDPAMIRCVNVRNIYCIPPIPSVNSQIQLMPLDWRTAFVECYPGFEFNASTYRIQLTCDASGRWTPNVIGISCSPITCSPPPNVTNTTRQFTGTAYGELVTYSCNTGYSFNRFPNGSTLYSVCVTSSSWEPDASTMQCQLIDCGEPLGFSVPNTISVNYTNTTYTSTVQFFCISSFHYIDENGTSQDAVTGYCNEHGEWILNIRNTTTGVYQSPYCSPISCGDPPTIANGQIRLASGRNFDAIAEIQCEAGYEVIPQSASSTTNTSFTLRCSANALWLSSLSVPTTYPTCMRMQCPTLPTITNGAYTYGGGSSANRNFQDTATLACDSGFLTSFGANVTLECVWYGDWAPGVNQLVCRSGRCPAPPTMQFATGGGDTTIGRQWTYTCIAGYEVERGLNEVSIDCVSPGTWSPSFHLVPRCRSLSCGAPLPYPGSARAYAADGTEIPPSDTNFYVGVGSNVTFRCFEGFWIVSDRSTSRSLQCTASRDYMPDPGTLPNCVVVSCPSPPEVTGAVSVGRRAGATSYVFGNVIRFMCGPGNFMESILLQTVDSFCAVNGSFVPNPATLLCSATRCRNLVLPFADIIEVTGYVIGSRVTYSCHSGAWYRRGQKRQTYVCTVDGRWIPDLNTFRCVPIRCPFPIISNARNTTSYVEFGTDVLLQCNDGYYPNGASTITCSDIGQLVPPPTTISCTPLVCNTPPTNANVELATTTLQFGTPVEVRCTRGYWLRPGVYSIMISCLSDGRWSQDTTRITCSRVQCAPPPRPDRSFQLGNKTIFGARVAVSCEPGYWFPTLSMQSVAITCDENGRWFPRLPSGCLSIQCGIPITILHASVIYKGSRFQSSATYTCIPFYWIANRNGTHWILTGQKSVVTVCGNTGSWTPFPNLNFICLALFVGNVPIDSPAVTATFTSPRTASSTVLPYRRLMRTARAGWLEFDSQTMTISDSYLPNEQQNEQEIYRDVRFVWDRNALTFWTAPLLQATQMRDWSIDIYLGKAQAVYAFMIMCADDGEADITSFSLIFAGSDAKFTSLGEFKVYGATGTSGTPESSFPVNYSSVATAWVYGGLASEMLWVHIVIHNTVSAGFRPIVREVGFYSSDAVWELTGPIDPLPSLFLVIVFASVLVVFAPVLLYLDERYSVKTLFMPPLTKNNSIKNFYSIKFCLLTEEPPAPSINILFHVCPDGQTHFSIPWIRGNDHRKLFYRKRNYCSIIAHTDNFKIDEEPSLKILAWRVVEDPLVGYPRITDPIFEPADLQITNIYVTNLSTGDKWSSAHDYKHSRFGKSAIPYTLISHDVCKVPLREFQFRPLFETNFVKILRCHHVFAMFVPPENSQVRRLDRFLMTLLFIVSATVLTISLQIFSGILPPTIVDPGQEMFYMSLDEESSVFLRGERGYFALATISCLLCIPLSIILRYLYVVDKLFSAKREGARDMLYEFCSHRVFFPLNVLRIPFMKVLSRPLASLLSVVINDAPQADVTTSVKEALSDEFFTANDNFVARRWSNLDLRPVNQEKSDPEFHEITYHVPTLYSPQQFAQRDNAIKSDQQLDSSHPSHIRPTSTTFFRKDDEIRPEIVVSHQSSWRNESALSLDLESNTDMKPKSISYKETHREGVAASHHSMPPLQENKLSSYNTIDTSDTMCTANEDFSSCCTGSTAYTSRYMLCEKHLSKDSCSSSELDEQDLWGCPLSKCVLDEGDLWKDPSSCSGSISTFSSALHNPDYDEETDLSQFSRTRRQKHGSRSTLNTDRSETSYTGDSELQNEDKSKTSIRSPIKQSYKYATFEPFSFFDDGDTSTNSSHFPRSKKELKQTERYFLKPEDAGGSIESTSTVNEKFTSDRSTDDHESRSSLSPSLKLRNYDVIDEDDFPQITDSLQLQSDVSRMPSTISDNAVDEENQFVRKDLYQTSLSGSDLKLNEKHSEIPSYESDEDDESGLSQDPPQPTDDAPEKVSVSRSIRSATSHPDSINEVDSFLPESLDDRLIENSHPIKGGNAKESNDRIVSFDKDVSEHSITPLSSITEITGSEEGETDLSNSLSDSSYEEKSRKRKKGSQKLPRVSASVPQPSGYVNFPKSKGSRWSTSNLRERRKKHTQGLTSDPINHKTHICTGDSRLHYSVVTHLSYHDPVCPYPITFRALLSFFLLTGVVALLLYMLWLGQNIGSEATGAVYRGAYYSFFITITVVLFFDAAVGKFVFNEL